MCRRGYPASADDSATSTKCVYSSATSLANAWLMWSEHCLSATAIVDAKKRKSQKVEKSHWEHEFICLASCGQLAPPTSMNKVNLIRAGLGPKKMPFLDFGEPFEFHDELISAFLRDAGGYELLRTQQHSTRELFVISPPSGGYTVEYLHHIVGQAKVFIRPIQKDLFLDPLVDDNDDLVCLQ